MRKFIGFLVLSLAVTAFSMACDENGKCTHTDKAACMAAMKAAAEKGCDHAKAVTADVTASSAETKACCASEKATKASCSGEAAKASCSSKAAAAAASCEKISCGGRIHMQQVCWVRRQSFRRCVCNQEILLCQQAGKH